MAYIPEYPGEITIGKVICNELEIIDKNVGIIDLDEIPTVTTLYVNYSSGSDGNSGYTESSPKKTLISIFKLLKSRIKNNTTVNIRGDHPDAVDYEPISVTIDRGKFLVLDGGPDYTTVLAEQTTTSATKSLLTVSAAGWTAEDYTGYFVKMTSGNCIGQTRLIQKSGTETIISVSDFSEAGGAMAIGDKFIIVKPTTNVYGLSPDIQGSGTLIIQRMTIGGVYSGPTYGGAIKDNAAGGRVQLSHLVLQRNGQGPAIQILGGMATLSGIYKDPATFADHSYLDSFCGVGQVAPQAGTAGTYILFVDVNNLYIDASSLAQLSCYNCGIYTIGYGFRNRMGARMVGCHNRLDTYGLLGSAGYATTTFEDAASTDLSSGIGLKMIDCNIGISGVVDFSGNDSHGLSCNNCHIFCAAAITGTGNTGAGAYVFEGSKFFFANTLTPTLTGTVGELAVTDPTAQQSTWAAIDGGAYVWAESEATLVNERT